MASSRVPTAKEKIEITTTKPNWLELPKDVTLNILQRLDTVEIITSTCLVCPLWWNFCKDPYIWRTIHMPEFYHRHYNRADWVKMCQYAVDRSCGQLEDIYIYMFGNDKLLEYIADRASDLKRVRLRHCNELSDKGFIEAVKKLPLLEELAISNNNHLSKHSFEAVGSCCPLSKTLTFDKDATIHQNDEAFVIAKTMPVLRSLTISGGQVITSDGLVAILNGCPLLEYLDLRNCCYVYRNKSLRKRCCEQIKKFMPPILEDYYYYSDSDSWYSDSDSWYSD